MSNQLSRKPSVIHILRRIIQIAAFLLAPGLFATIFDSVGALVMAAAGHYSGDLLVPVVTVVIILSITALFGRFFCGFFCSFGAMGDFLWFLSKKAAPKKHRISEKADAVLKSVKYIILAAIVTLVWISAAVNIPASYNPWTVFGMYASIGGWPSPTWLLSVGGLLLAGIMVGSLFVERFFCRYLCPLGASFALVSRFRLFNIIKHRENCGSCSACTSRCSMGIGLYKTDVVTSGECINCFGCTEICPRRNAHANPAPAVASAMSVAAITGLCYAGNVLTAVAAPEPSAIEAVQETESFGSSASSQAASSAGTASSGTSAASASASKSTSAAAASTSAASVSSGTYKDGTYTGTGTGFRGTTKVTVTVSGGKITDIEVVSYQDNDPYFSRAKSTVISEILKDQTVKVSAVSGATFSSNGIMEAVANALGVSYTNPNSSMSGGKKR
jgi:polyferredoxin/uncharacterized protein with FMN-binding domain